MGEAYLIGRFSIELIDEYEREEIDKQQTYNILNTSQSLDVAFAVSSIQPLHVTVEGYNDSCNHSSILPRSSHMTPMQGAEQVFLAFSFPR